MKGFVTCDLRAFRYLKVRISFFFLRIVQAAAENAGERYKTRKRNVFSQILTNISECSFLQNSFSKKNYVLTFANETKLIV